MSSPPALTAKILAGCEALRQPLADGVNRLLPDGFIKLNIVEFRAGGIARTPTRFTLGGVVLANCRVP